MGAPRSAYADQHMVIIRRDAVLGLGDWTAAGLFQRIAWRCEQTGEWRATYQEIADEVWLSRDQIKRALARLRESGWITVTQDHPNSRTLTYTINWDETPSQAERAKSPDQRANLPDERASAPAQRAKSPYRKGEIALSSIYRDSRDRDTRARDQRSDSGRAANTITDWLSSLPFKPQRRTTGQLRAHVEDAIYETGVDPGIVREALDRWAERSGAGAGLLPSLIDDVQRERARDRKEAKQVMFR